MTLSPFGRIHLLGLTLLLIGALGCGSTSEAADDAAPPAPAGSLTVPASPAAIGENMKQELAKAVTELTNLEARMQKLGAEYQTADPNRKLVIRKEAKQIEAQMNERGARVAEIFPALYKEAPNDPALIAMMPRMMTTLIQKHRFKDVAAYGEKLNASGKIDGRSAEVLALALFAEHRFADAQKVLEDAQAKKLLQPGQSRLLPSTKSYQKLWEVEKKLRAAEEAKNDLPRVLLKTTKGDITIELFEDQAPGAVGNFVSLVEKKFYDGIVFHRVIPLFMAQGGDPNTLDDNPANDGQGGPGYKIPCECERPDKRNHFSGSLSMAHAGKNTGGSQFFLTFIPTEHLNGRHTVFGRIVAGIDVQRSLIKGDKIITATVTRKRNHDYAPPAGK